MGGEVREKGSLKPGSLNKGERILSFFAFTAVRVNTTAAVKTNLDSPHVANRLF